MSITFKKNNKDRGRDENSKGSGTDGRADVDISTGKVIIDSTTEAANTNTINIPETSPNLSNEITREENTTNSQEEKMVSSSSSYDSTKPTTNASSTLSDQYRSEQNFHLQSEEQQSKINKALDEIRDNIRKSTDEAKKDIPHYTRAASEYQEQTIDTTKELAENFLESQKQILNSFQSISISQIESANRIFVSNWIFPRQFSQIYAYMIGKSAENMITGTRLANNMIFANMEAFRNLILQTRDSAKELSKSNINIARSIEQKSRD
jgi:hypothetical protein